tara:strand:+ start:552 stop:806 length:255 start_codon:yes stop_codon:yes gene_type:complete
MYKGHITILKTKVIHELEGYTRASSSLKKVNILHKDETWKIQDLYSRGKQNGLNYYLSKNGGSRVILSKECVRKLYNEKILKPI